MPDFSKYYKELDKDQKRALISKYTQDTGHSENTWFQKNNPKRKQSFTKLEILWLEKYTGITKEELFPDKYKV